MRVLVIYNPLAGALPARPIVERAANWWRASGWQVDIEITGRSGEGRQFARRAAAESLDAVIVAGGDGTLSEVADGLAGSGTALGLLPLGTANLWAREVGLRPIGERGAPKVEDYAELIARSTLRRVDLGKVGSRHFLLWLGAGLDGYIVSRVEPRTRLAKLLGEVYYLAAAFAVAPGWAGVPMEVVVDGQAIADHLMLVLIGNNRRYAGRVFRISPNARIDDGLLEVWAFRGRSFADALPLAWALWHGRHVDRSDVFFRSGKHITISGPASVPSQVDGDILDQPMPLTVSVVPGALRLLVPPGAPADLFSTDPML